MNTKMSPLRRSGYEGWIVWMITAVILIAGNAGGARRASWRYYSTERGNIPQPNAGSQQTASLVLDIDKDGTDDFVITERTETPSVVWYKYQSDGNWARFVIDDTHLRIEAGGDYFDIDSDGDLDIVFGGDAGSNQIWWWENPYPNFKKDTPWKRYIIKNSGKNKHHDQIFGDFDGDGKTELVSWNQGAGHLLLIEIPENPQVDREWDQKVIFKATGRYEGLATADIDLDGKIDIIGAGRWFKHEARPSEGLAEPARRTAGENGTEFKENVIDGSDGREFSRIAAGQLIAGGRPEVVIVPGDADGPLKWYQWKDGSWVAHQLHEKIVHGHSLAVRDINNDGHLDIFVAEMGRPGAGAEARTRVYWGDSKGNFTEDVIDIGKANHESKFGDLDGDGDIDILGKPYSYGAPGLHVWLQEF
jgi:hypothetical protein